MIKVKESEKIAQTTVQIPGAKGVSIRRLIGKKDDAPTFAMRLFEVAPGGHTPLHRHAHEHEVFILDGQGSVSGSWGKMSLLAGSAVFVPGQKEHQFINVGNEPLRFLCLVPVAADG